MDRCLASVIPFLISEGGKRELWPQPFHGSKVSWYWKCDMTLWTGKGQVEGWEHRAPLALPKPGVWPLSRLTSALQRLFSLCRVGTTNSLLLLLMTMTQVVFLSRRPAHSKVLEKGHVSSAALGRPACSPSSRRPGVRVPFQISYHPAVPWNLGLSAVRVEVNPRNAGPGRLSGALELGHTQRESSPW